MNVVVIVVDRLRADHLGCYGNSWIETPYIDGFAAESVVFDQYVSENPTSVAARRAWWSAEYTFPRSEAADAPTADEIPPGSRHRIIADCLRARGVETLWLGSKFWKSRDADWPRCEAMIGGPFERTSHFSKAESLSGFLAQRVARCLEESSRPRRPLLAWIEVSNLLVPTQVARDYAGRYDGVADSEAECDAEPDTDPPPDDGGYVVPQDQLDYAAAVSWADAQVGTLLTVLRSEPAWSDTAVFLLSDRGEQFTAERAQRPWLGRTPTGDELPTMLHEELVHLPLMVRVPRMAQVIGRSRAIVQPPDLLPTVFELLEVPPPAFGGISFLGAVRADSDAARPFACAGFGTQRMFRDATWHLIHDRTARAQSGEPVAALYAKPDDRYERHDVASQFADVVQRLIGQTTEFERAQLQQGP